MDDKELKDLQLFGNNIDKKSISVKNIQKNEVEYCKLKQKNPNDKIKFTKILNKIFIFSSKLLLRFINFFYHKLKEKKSNISHKLYLKKIQKRKRLTHAQKKQISKNKSYRIVETCKRRKNKTIIVRKRVLLPFGENLIRPTKGIPSIYFLSVKDDENGKQITKPEAYTILKKSVWDFPAQNKKK